LNCVGFDRSVEILVEISSKPTTQTIANNSEQSLLAKNQDQEEDKILRIPFEKLEEQNEVLLKECQRQYLNVEKQRGSLSLLQYQQKITDLVCFFEKEKDEKEKDEKQKKKEFVLHQEQDRKRKNSKEAISRSFAENSR
jgi:hypothetical protein